MTHLATKCACDLPCEQAGLTERIADAATPVRLREGQRIWTTGQVADGALIVCRGAVTVSSFTASGQQHVMSVSSRGAPIGLDDVIDGVGRRSEVEVVMSGTALFLEAGRLHEMLNSGGSRAVAVAHLATRAVRAMGRRVGELGYGTVEQRIARLLVRLCDDGGLRDQRGIFLPLRISRVRLAVILDCRTETLVRVLKSAPMSDMLSFTREGILVRDLDALRTLGGVS